MTSPSLTESAVEARPHKHDWSVWKIIGHTGDWFTPHILERKCKTCGKTEDRDG